MSGFIKMIDLNADVGERTEALSSGHEEKLISLISSANIACGGHAGDAHSILEVMKICKKYDVNIGAHPSYPDRLNFGRVALNLSADEITQFVFYQVESFVNIAKANGFEVRHVKPHGALYNRAARDENTARAILKGIEKISREFILYGLADSVMIDVWNNENFKTASEAFADRRYESDGSLRSRDFFDAVYSSPEDAALQSFLIANEGKVVSVDGNEINLNADTLCVHGDTESAFEMLKFIRDKFSENSIGVSGFQKQRE